LHALQNRAGQLEVRLEPFEADLAFVQKHPELATGLYARLQVRDTGASPDPELLQRAFDTSLTPRERIDTSELSLRLARTIAQHHNGLLTVDCQPQAGNVCSVYLPACLESTTGFPPDLPRGSGERVLFVDDELDCCQATEQLLRHLGFEPAAHTNPHAALEDFRSRPDHFDAAVLDLNMPALTGVDLATLLLELRPDLPVYIATGYSGLWTPEMAINLGIRGILSKPVTPQDWLRILKEALEP
jgi:CheY-like chemotaxis protein